MARYAHRTGAHPGIINGDSSVLPHQCILLPIVVNFGNFDTIKEFFNRQTKARKFIDHNNELNGSTLYYEKWEFKHLINRERFIIFSINANNIEELFKRTFKGSLKQFKNKTVQSIIDNQIDTNLCLPNPDKITESLQTDNMQLAVLALNNCLCLTELEIDIKGDCNYQALSVEKLQLTRLTISNTYFDNFYLLLQDILKKSKATLRYFKSGGRLDLSPLIYSEQLKQLELKGIISQLDGIIKIQGR